jgi:hypothetical protein
MFQFCKKNNGKLVEIWTKQKQEEVDKFMDHFETTSDNQYWIGKLISSKNIDTQHIYSVSPLSSIGLNIKKFLNCHCFRITDKMMMSQFFEDNSFIYYIT